jgi:nucleotidyltransferase substrate binding protein (TIGR01987 family)
MNKKNIRWRQRFENFIKSLDLLKQAVEIKEMNEIERGGLIQFFEISFELAWKTMKDYLESEGYLLKSPREVIKQAFQIELINKGEIWLNALNDRNLIAHTYDEEVSLKLEVLIKTKYFPILQYLQQNLKNKI